MARQRVFDIDTAVDVAMRLFWRNGYERTSLSDLTGAMGITPPSFYFAFGSKDQLFKRVVETYIATRMAFAEAALDERDTRTAIAHMLRRLCDLYTDPAWPRGCLLVNNGLTFAHAADAAPALKDMADNATRRRERLRTRLAQGLTDGDLPAGCDLDHLTRYILVVGWGLATAALHNASRQDLYDTVATAMTAWPPQAP